MNVFEIEFDSQQQMIDFLEDLDQTFVLPLDGDEDAQIEFEEALGYEAGDVDYRARFRELNERHTQVVDELVDTSQELADVSLRLHQIEHLNSLLRRDVEVLTRLYQRALGENAGLMSIAGINI